MIFQYRNIKSFEIKLSLTVSSILWKEMFRTTLFIDDRVMLNDY